MNTKKLEAKNRLFFVSDIHGEITTLLHGLKELGFDEKKDTLVHAGDLIDRGRNSFDTAMFFLTDKTGSYYTVLGNHDVFAFENNHASNCHLWAINGGMWAFQELLEDEREFLGDCMKELPYAIEVLHKGLSYGVVHAGVPEELSWQQFVNCLKDDNPAAKKEAVWMRDIVEYSKYYQDNFVKGIDFTVHGHTPVKEPLMIANRLHIDTGLVYGKYLTITEALGNGEFEHHKFNLQEL